MGSEEEDAAKSADMLSGEVSDFGKSAEEVFGWRKRKRFGGDNKGFTTHSSTCPTI
jgi:hypothetical protein